MLLLGKDLSALTNDDLQRLNENQIREGQKIEYKSQLPGHTDGDKKEFLADVSSFANTSGGHLIFGISAKEGLPTALDGIEIDNMDKEILRLDHIIQDGIDPRIIGIRIVPIDVDNKRTILVVEIPRSWLSPHMVSFKGSSRFYARNSGGKYPLDSLQIRRAFTQSESISAQLRSFRAERIAQIRGGELPVRVVPGVTVVLHLVPFAALEPGRRIPIDSLDVRLKPIEANAFNYRHTFDGFLTHVDLPDQSGTYTYTQLHWNGAIEAVWTAVPNDDGKIIPGDHFENNILSSAFRYWNLLKELGDHIPCAIMLTVLNAKGYRMGVNQERSVYNNKNVPIDRDILLIPEAVVVDENQLLGDSMQPIFDSFWNATGWVRSPLPRK